VSINFISAGKSVNLNWTSLETHPNHHLIVLDINSAVSVFRNMCKAVICRQEKYLVTSRCTSWREQLVTF